MKTLISREAALEASPNTNRMRSVKIDNKTVIFIKKTDIRTDEQVSQQYIDKLTKAMYAPKKPIPDLDLRGSIR